MVGKRRFVVAAALLCQCNALRPNTGTRGLSMSLRESKSSSRSEGLREPYQRTIDEWLETTGPNVKSEGLFEPYQEALLGGPSKGFDWENDYQKCEPPAPWRKPARRVYPDANEPPLGSSAEISSSIAVAQLALKQALALISEGDQEDYLYLDHSKRATLLQQTRSAAAELQLLTTSMLYADSAVIDCSFADDR